MLPSFRVGSEEHIRMVTPTLADHQHMAPLVMDYHSAIVAGVAERRPELIERAAAVFR